MRFRFSRCLWFWLDIGCWRDDMSRGRWLWKWDRDRRPTLSVVVQIEWLVMWRMWYVFLTAKMIHMPFDLATIVC